jgi:hypothetical protein
MNFHFPFFKPRVPYERELIAGLRDQIIELGTHVRFLEADKRDPQPRDDAGRYVSKVEITRQRLARLVSRLTPEEAQSARMRGMGGGR